MMSQPVEQIITSHMLPNISRSKGNQEMKFGQLIEHNKRNIFYQKSPFFVFWKNLCEVKTSGL